MLGRGGRPTPLVFSMFGIRLPRRDTTTECQGLCYPLGREIPRWRCNSVATCTRKEKVRGLKLPLTFGVSDGTRTRDIQDHNLTLYQLNYTHHCRQTRSGDVDTSCSGPSGPNPFPPARPVQPRARRPRQRSRWSWGPAVLRMRSAGSTAAHGWIRGYRPARGAPDPWPAGRSRSADTTGGTAP